MSSEGNEYEKHLRVTNEIPRSKQMPPYYNNILLKFDSICNLWSVFHEPDKSLHK